MSLWHGHGDQSLYGTLVNMVDQGYAIGQGNWGAVSRFGTDNAASYRYTETKLSPWVDKLAFKYYKYVPWEEIEQDEEPLYLPSPVPLGLIGDGIIQGIAFHRTVLPKYDFKDLIKRCISLIEGKPVEENIIMPLIRGCTTQQINKHDYLDLLTKGFGELFIIPNGNILKTKIEVLGRSPFKSFNSLLKASEGKDKKLNVHIDDMCGKDIKLVITPKNKKKTSIDNLAKDIWINYITSKSKFICYTCDENGQINQLGIDDLIKLSYNNWSLAALNKKIDDLNKINKKKFEVNVIEIIRYIFEKYKAHKVDDIIKQFHQISNGKTHMINFDMFDANNKSWSVIQASVEEDDIREICQKKSIQSLIEHKTTINEINIQLNEIKKNINNNDQLCLNEVKGMI